MLGPQSYIDQVGPVVSAAWLNEMDAMRYLKAVKPAATARTASTTLIADPNLGFPTVPAGNWRMTGFLQPQNATTGTQGFKFSIQGPGLGTGVGFYSGAINGAQVPQTIAGGSNLVFAFANMSVSAIDFITFDLSYTQTVAGVINLLWAQNSSSANATMLNALSWMILERLA